ncbi:hypothetical protein GPEL0_01r0150 [Geoanaerobacter pelophilus]|uniref:Uncharacterized protein n=1 Tax=Geoanaerobacter pelophilus TaxID=60036 RepID=A0ABQ0MDZ4_9BACT|nr:hypothetical protein [Geoanaerobacter pelophilus]GAW65328.1 hypothetical protein GPEL0_01r0150 [Geoanaerobacter pelophilus]
MSDTENQMGLFETGEVLPEKPLDPPTPQAPQAPPTHPEARPRPAAKTVESPAAARSERAAQKPSRKKEPAKGAKAVSGLVPEGDVRLTANIRQDLHLKLKIASAYRRTTIGEIIEELVEKYV